MFVSHVIGDGHVQRRSRSALNSNWAHTVVNIVHCHWNDFRYPKILVYFNSIRFIDDLRMLKKLVLCRRVVWRYSKIPFTFAGKNINCKLKKFNAQDARTIKPPTLSRLRRCIDRRHFQKKLGKVAGCCYQEKRYPRWARGLWLNILQMNSRKELMFFEIYSEGCENIYFQKRSENTINKEWDESAKWLPDTEMKSDDLYLVAPNMRV